MTIITYLKGCLLQIRDTKLFVYRFTGKLVSVLLLFLLKRLLLLTLVFFIPLIAVSLFVGYKSSDGIYKYSVKGWPVAYQKTISDNGLCTGYAAATVNSGSCNIIRFKTNHYALEADICFWIVVSLVLSSAAAYYPSGKPKKHKVKA